MLVRLGDFMLKKIEYNCTFENCYFNLSIFSEKDYKYAKNFFKNYAKNNNTKIIKIISKEVNVYSAAELEEISSENDVFAKDLTKNGNEIIRNLYVTVPDICNRTKYVKCWAIYEYGFFRKFYNFDKYDIYVEKWILVSEC